MKFKQFYESDWSAKDDDYHSQEMNTFADSRTRLIEKTWLPLLRGRSPQTVKVLDASCASGGFVRFFKSLMLGVVAIDIAFDATRRTRRSVPGASVAVASAEEGLPFRNESFDVVWFGETLAALFDGHNALSEFNRVLKPNGLLVLTTPYHGRLKNLAIALHGFEKHYYPDNYRIRFYNKKSLEVALIWSGFAPRYWKGVGGFWPLWQSLFVIAEKRRPPGPAPARIDPDERLDPKAILNYSRDRA